MVAEAFCPLDRGLITNQPGTGKAIVLADGHLSFNYQAEKRPFHPDLGRAGEPNRRFRAKTGHRMAFPNLTLQEIEDRQPRSTARNLQGRLQSLLQRHNLGDG
jgi:hypothetical protein